MDTDKPNSAEHIQRILTVEILRGAHPVGARLPTVRALAARFGVNPATIQRAVARLGLTGLVTPRQGSGMRVNDPAVVGDVSLVPAWLEAYSHNPIRAASVLEDLLEVRRVLAARLLVRHRARLAESAAELLEVAEAFVRAEADIVALRDADLALVKTIIAKTGNQVAMAIFNTAERVLKTSPHVAEAMYADSRQNLAQLELVLAALMGDSPEGEVFMAVEGALAALDRQTVARYRQRLEASC